MKAQHRAPVLQSARLKLAPLQPTDAAALYAYRSDPEVARFQDFCPADESAALAFIQRSTAEFDQPDTWFQLGLYREGRLVGDLGLHFVSADHRECELGYTLARAEQGKGYGVEAVTAVTAYLFGTLGKVRLVARVDPRNVASVKLLERAGFRPVEDDGGGAGERTYELHAREERRR